MSVKGVVSLVCKDTDIFHYGTGICESGVAVTYLRTERFGYSKYLVAVEIQ
jgi:hypothetical protein